jgi:hypothetical protein
MITPHSGIFGVQKLRMEACGVQIACAFINHEKEDVNALYTYIIVAGY